MGSVGTGNYLWCADTNQYAFFKHDPDTGEIVERVQLADDDPIPHGMSIRTASCGTATTSASSAGWR